MSAGTRPIVTLGETMGLLRTTELGSLAQLQELRAGIGGAESNVAIGLARLGIPVTWLGRVGDDALGRRIVRELRAEGVTTEAVVDAEAPTGVMLKEQPAPGRSVVQYYRTGSAGSRLTPTDLDALDIEQSALLHITGITAALSEQARATVHAAAARAAAAGVPISFDVNHRSRLWRDEAWRAEYLALARHADIVFAGEDEAALLAPGLREPAELAAAIAELGPRTVVIKRGAAGAAALDAGTWYEQSAVPITPVDTVGAGDAFVAGWLAEWHRDASPAGRLAVAVRAGAHACLHPGDWEGLPFRRELLASGGDPVSR